MLSLDRLDRGKRQWVEVISWGWFDGYWVEEVY
jgi:hypothetical protein